MPSTSSASDSFSCMRTALLLLLVACTLHAATANDDADALQRTHQQFFRRNAKWINLPSGGGSLVSGRGNFRPGFHSSLRDRVMMAEPFLAFKRSPPPPYFSASRDNSVLMPEDGNNDNRIMLGLRR